MKNMVCGSVVQILPQECSRPRLTVVCSSSTNSTPPCGVRYSESIFCIWSIVIDSSCQCIQLHADLAVVPELRGGVLQLPELHARYGIARDKAGLHTGFFFLEGVGVYIEAHENFLPFYIKEPQNKV